MSGTTGTVIVEVSQAGNDNYNATSATESFNVIDNSLDNQTITFNTIADKTYGDDDFNLSATASSELTVSYTVISGNVTISGSTITITGVGDVTIEATQSGDATYNPAPAVQQSFTVEKAELTVTANDKSKIYGDVNPALTFEYSGFVNSEDASVLTTEPNASTTADASSDAGNYNIIVSGGSDDNYSFTYVNATLTINKADQTISITAIDDKDLADSPPPFDVTANTTSGLDLTYAIQSGPATISGTTITLSGTTGTVIVEVSQVGNTNYNAASATESFNVTDNSLEDQTIAFDAIAGKTYGGDDFNLSATASSELAVSYAVISGPVTITGSTVSITGAGDVTIEASQAGDDTYNTAPAVQQLFTVEKAGLTVSVVSDTISIDDNMPEFVIEYLGFVNGENTDVLDELPVATCNADENSDEGNYDIIVSGGVDDNYSFIYISGILTIESTSSINFVESLNVKIYPNPTSQYLYIENTSEIEITHIEVYSSIGKKLYDSKMGDLTIDVSTFLQGTYIIKLNSCYTKVFMKE